MRAILQGLAMALLVVATGIAGSSPPAAESVLAEAEAQAAGQHKKILLLFEASW